VPTSVLPLPNSKNEPLLIDYDPSDTNVYPRVANAAEGESPTFISNRGRFYSATELGRVFDPVMFIPSYVEPSGTASQDNIAIQDGRMPTNNHVSWPSVETVSDSSTFHGGGNTLRIGRPEHPKFDRPAKHFPAEIPGNHAARLLDLFHAGKSRSSDSSEREGSLVRIEGNVNVNTASKDALRAMAAGFLEADPKLSKRTSEVHSASTGAPPVTALQLSALSKSQEADMLAEAIILGRPYSAPSELASAMTSDGKIAFGNPLLYPYTVSSKPQISSIQWSDSAAEETFARVYNSSTVRSRNFRVWVIAQSLAPTRTDDKSPEVLSEVRKAYTVFANPGPRKSDNSIDKTKFKVTTLNENDF